MISFTVIVLIICCIFQMTVMFKLNKTIKFWKEQYTLAMENRAQERVNAQENFNRLKELVPEEVYDKYFGLTAIGG